VLRSSPNLFPIERVALPLHAGHVLHLRCGVRVDAAVEDDRSSTRSHRQGYLTIARLEIFCPSVA
jgi:hypothetical protein